MDSWLSKLGLDVENNEPKQVLKYLHRRAAMAAQSTARDKRRRRELITENESSIRAHIHGSENESADPLDILMADEQILINLNSLSAVLKDTLIQYYIEGRSPEEIAETLNENVGAVRKRITRARNLLKGEK